MSDVFSSDQSVTGQETAPQSDPYADLLAEITNEDGVQKYKDAQDALVGLKNAQEHIRKLQQENTEYRSELDKRLSAAQVLEELKTRNKPDEKPSHEFSPEVIQELVDKRLEARTKEQVAKDNVKKVNEVLTAKFADKAKEVVDAKARELGLSPESLKQLSAESPNAVLALFGAASTKQDAVPGKPQGSVNTEANPTFSKRNYAYYQNLRRTDARAYREVYSQMLRDAEKMGSEFYS